MIKKALKEGIELGLSFGMFVVTALTCLFGLIGTIVLILKVWEYLNGNH